VLSGEREAAEAVWRPLLDWPLLPLADGRLLKLRYRELALAVLPEYQQRPGAGGKSTREGAEQEVSTVWAALLDQCFLIRGRIRGCPMSLVGSLPGVFRQGLNHLIVTVTA
jgi:hypothetical protein